MESRFQRGQQSIANRRLVNAIRQISAIFCPGAIPLHPARYLFASGWVLKLQGAERKNRGEPKRKVPARNFSLFYARVTTICKSLQYGNISQRGIRTKMAWDSVPTSSSKAGAL
jgi:hypothetical protein